MSAMQTLLFPVRDLAAAKSIFGALLGVEPMADADYYVGYQTDDLHVGLVPGGFDQGMTGPLCNWHVPDIEASIQELVAAGATVRQDPRDVGGGRLVAVLTDPDGNPIGLIQG
jgi:predicted enzyme related to lactoylglutathione lyase